MEFVYVSVPDGAEWEDLTIYVTEEEGRAASIRHPCVRVEIFQRRPGGGFVPTYHYFLNGVRHSGE